MLCQQQCLESSTFRLLKRKEFGKPLLAQLADELKQLILI